MRKLNNLTLDIYTDSWKDFKIQLSFFISRKKTRRNNFDQIFWFHREIQWYFYYFRNDFESNFILNLKNFEKKMINNRKIKKEYVFKKFIYNTFFKGDFIDYWVFFIFMVFSFYY